jgi:hypothetical protein
MIRHIRKGPIRAKLDVRHALESLFVAESLFGSPEIWIVSPWISDVPIIDNRGGQYAHLTTLGNKRILMSEILVFLSSKFGTKVTVVISDHEWAIEFRTNLPRAFAEQKKSNLLNLVVKSQYELHEKSITTKDWQVGGSMNFTKQGIEVRDEVVTIDNTSESLAEAIIDLRNRFPWPTE